MSEILSTFNFVILEGPVLLLTLLVAVVAELANGALLQRLRCFETVCTVPFGMICP